MDETLSDDLIRYDILTQDALRSVISKVLEEVASTGLPGDHHFFITFETGHPGVKLSSRMRERYPEEMTIVIQHSFWDLAIKETYFEIDLSFDDIRERLRVPFASIKGFYDPSVKFGLQFDVEYDIDEELVSEGNPEPQEVDGLEAAANAPEDTESNLANASDGDPDNDKDGGADVVSLDSFRKKK